MTNVLIFPFEQGYRLVSGNDLNRMIEALNAAFAQTVTISSVGSLGANPSATVGPTATNGVASTFLRSDAAPAVNLTAAYNWTGLHSFTSITASGSIAGNTSVTAGIGSNSVQMTGAPNGSDPTIQALGVTDTNVSIQFQAKGTGVLKMISPTAFSSNVAVAGTLGSSANTSLPSVTNSGVSLGAAPNYAITNFYDQSLSVNNRTAQIIWLSSKFAIRFANDAAGAVVEPLSFTGGQATGVTGIASTSGSGVWAHTGGMTVSGTLSVGGASVARVVAADNKVAQAANVNTPALYAVTTSGLYRVSTFIVVSQAATTSSTMPSVNVTYTEAVTGVAVSDPSTLSAAGNTLGLHNGGSVVVQAQTGTNIGYTTGSYASSGATPMQYAITVKVEALQ